MEQFAKRGEICPNPACPLHGKLQAPQAKAHIIKAGKSSLTRVKGHKEDTILKWLREAARHAGEVEEVLMKDFRVKRGQLDALWLYVGNKGEKKLPHIAVLKSKNGRLTTIYGAKSIYTTNLMLKLTMEWL